MRPSTLTLKAAVVAGASMLVTGIAPPAVAHDAQPYVTPYQATSLDMRGLLDPAGFHAVLDRKLAALATATTALNAKVAAIPTTTVLTGDARRTAEARLARAAFLARVLAAIPTTGAYAATASERTEIAAIQRTLAATRTALRTLLANAPAAVRTAVRTTTPKTTIRTRWSRWAAWWTNHDGTWDGHHCDHR